MPSGLPDDEGSGFCSVGFSAGCSTGLTGGGGGKSSLAGAASVTGSGSGVGASSWAVVSADSAGASPRRDVLDEGELELERELVADEHATGIELRIPRHAPVLAIDAAGALETGTQVAERVGVDADELERDRHGLRHVTDRQITGDDVGALVHLVDG